MFFKTALTFLAVGALSVNALTAPVARSPAPEPECEFPRSFSIISCHDLTLVPFNSPQERGDCSRAHRTAAGFRAWEARPILRHSKKSMGGQGQGPLKTREAQSSVNAEVDYFVAYCVLSTDKLQ